MGLWPGKQPRPRGGTEGASEVTLQLCFSLCFSQSKTFSFDLFSQSCLWKQPLPRCFQGKDEGMNWWGWGATLPLFSQL